MSASESFVQLLDAVKDKFSITDREIARLVGCRSTYISRLRNGKANAGPSIVRSLRRLLDGEKPPINPSGSAMVSISSLAALAGVSENKLIAELVNRCGLDVASDLKREREEEETEPESKYKSIDDLISKLDLKKRF